LSIFQGNRALLDAFRRGDRPALTAVYRAYATDVAALVRRGFRDGGQSAVPGIRESDGQRDAVQEVFVRAFSEKARLAFDGLSPYRPYLMRIAKNLMIDQARKSGRLAQVSSSETLDASSDSLLDQSPEEELEWRTLRQATHDYCSKLEPTLQRLVQLRFEEEQSQQDVADILGVSRRKVRNWENQIRAGLERHLKTRAAQRAPSVVKEKEGSH
jgi:RNA polymerase sigma factor (sigma-70 family)